MTARLKSLASFAGIVLGLSACGGAGTSAMNQNASSSQELTPAVVPAAAAASSSTANAISSMMLSAPEPRLDIGVGTSHRLLTAPIINDSGSCNLCAIIEGTNTADGYGMEGVTTGGGAGMYGIAANTSPIFTTGVYGAGVGTGAEGVYGIAKGSGYGVYGVSVAGTGVAGISSNPTGYGGAFTNTTAGGLGVNIITTGGTALQATTTTAETISARSSSNSAVYAESDSGTGAGVFANTFSNVLAVRADGDVGGAIDSTNSSTTANIVANNGGSGAGIDVTSFSGTGLVTHQGSGSGADIIDSFDGTDTFVFGVDHTGGVFYHGGLHPFVAMTHGHASAYSPSVASPTIEDTGTAQLANGSARVAFDPTFAQAIESGRPYQVMVTPGGDTRGLFVTEKSATGFVVREVQGGRSSITFDYHIYATPLGGANKRMAQVSPESMPKAPLEPRMSAKPASHAIR